MRAPLVMVKVKAYVKKKYQQLTMWNYVKRRRRRECVRDCAGVLLSVRDVLADYTFL